MKSDNWIESFVAARLAEQDERARLHRVGKATRSAKWHAVIVARERATVERARLRELRNKPCGARTRSGHPCRRKGLGKGGRCPNHGGMSTGPRTPEGRARISAALKARCAANEKRRKIKLAHRQRRLARRSWFQQGRLCGAPTRNGTSCKRRAQPNGRCLTHGGTG